MPPKTKAQPGAVPPLGVHPLPSVPTPTPPDGFVPPVARELLGSHPRQMEVALADEVVEELDGFGDYGAIFGATAPPLARMTKLLAFARRWRVERDAAAAWNTYVRAQDALAWKAALDMLDKLKPAYKLALEQQPELATKYPRLTDFFDAHRQIARRASATKSRKKAAAKAQAASPAPKAEEG